MRRRHPWRHPAALWASCLLLAVLSACAEDTAPVLTTPDEEVDAGTNNGEPDRDATAREDVAEEDATPDTSEPDTSDPDTGEPDVPVDPECVDNAQFFLEEVWTPVLSQTCFRCHNPLGAASQSGMVFQPSGYHGFLEHNLSVFTETAAFERDGVSVMLLKPTAQVDHGGGLQIATDSEAYAALEAMIARIGDPVVCEEEQQTDDTLFDGVVLLDADQTLRKASLNLVGRLPTMDERALVAEGGAQGLEAALDRIMVEDAFITRMTEIWGDVFLTDKYLGRTNASDLLDRRYYPNARWYYDAEYDNSYLDPRFVAAGAVHTNDSVAREPLMLVRHILENDKPFTEVLTADYIMLNPFSAQVYGVTDAQWDNPLNPDEFQPLQIEGQTHAGVLTSPMFLNRFPTTATNRNRHRAAKTLLFFLATDILDLGQRPIDPTSTVHNPTMNDSQCAGCHAVMDPVAGSFQNWDTSGAYVPPDSWFENMRAPGFGTEEIPAEERANSLPWLAQRLTNDDRFGVAMSHIVYQGLTGLAPLKLPGVNVEPEQAAAGVRAFEAQQAFFDRAAKEFRENGHDLRILVKHVVRSPWFRAVNTDGALDGQRAAELDQLGMGTRLSPEQLSRKILATTGLPWRAGLRNNDYLIDINQYRILYGGIDFDDVTERLDGMNGMMFAVQDLMANDMSCKVTAYDFAFETGERLLFPHVELSYTPRDENGFDVPQAQEAIRRNIQHLHARLLGEELALDDPEIDATYALFEATWTEGQEKLAEGELSTSLAWQCRGRTEFWTQTPFENPVNSDPDYTVRAWQAVLTYLLLDYRFVVEE